jgi:hypothetical protein
MRRVFKIIFLLVIFSLFFLSCEDVVDIEVPNETPKLVIDASINWEKSTSGNEQLINLSLSTPYFATQKNIPAIGASVQVLNIANNTITNFTDNNDGTYTTDVFLPELNTEYQLDVTYGGEQYSSIETFKSVASISNVNQSITGGFNDSLTEINIFFNDPALEENYYLIKFQQTTDVIPYFITLRDEFTNGNEMTIFFEKDDEDSDLDALNPGDEVNIELTGISKQYYNYMSLLLQQTDGQGPFSSTPAPVNGNCVNITDATNTPYGYFRLTEVDAKQYTVQ